MGRRSIVIELVGGCLVAAYFVAAKDAARYDAVRTRRLSAIDHARSVALQQAAGLAVVAAAVLAAGGRCVVSWS